MGYKSSAENFANLPPKFPLKFRFSV